MTRSHRSNRGRRKLLPLGVAFAALAGCIGAVVLNGLLYELTDGSNVGMFATIFAVALGLGLAAAAVWVFVILAARAVRPGVGHNAALRPAPRRRTVR